MRTAPSAGPLASFGATRLCLLVAFVALATLTYLYVDTHTIQRFLKTVESDPYGSLPAFLVAYTVSVVVLFPCMIMQVMSGALYGFWMGLVVSWLATSVGQSLAFLLGRYLFRPTVKAYLHSTWPTFPAIDQAIKKEGWKLVGLLRLSPVLPYNVLNYALAITPVSFWVYSLTSALATVPWTALYVYLGTFSNNLMDLAKGKLPGQDMHLLKQVASGLLIAVSTVYGYILSHRAISAVLKEASKEAASDGGAGGSSGGGALLSNGAGLGGAGAGAVVNGLGPSHAHSSSNLVSMAALDGGAGVAGPASASFGGVGLHHHSHHHHQGGAPLFNGALREGGRHAGGLGPGEHRAGLGGRAGAGDIELGGGGRL